jgi:hypothetical protein
MTTHMVLELEVKHPGQAAKYLNTALPDKKYSFNEVFESINKELHKKYEGVEKYLVKQQKQQ